ncbi:PLASMODESMATA CALLOSE-BINDING PROTEIN 2-like [Rutidosis leptorrhynchoides]|uniref:PLASMODESMATA CALLOSE-BINDING PROTEIN 2-like n=1 Tax=Rutidosis leptorrhynchoides TaxID=125765 RepID=UPI003A9982A0
MATFTEVQLIIFIFRLLISGQPTSAAWCVAKNDASSDALQRGLDYACGNGADCNEILPSGKCFEPDTVQSHAAYVYSSYYEGSSKTPADCDFSGTATFTDTDPSYGSCVYPGSSSMTGRTKEKTSPTSNTKRTPPPKNGHVMPHENGDIRVSKIEDIHS